MAFLCSILFLILIGGIYYIKYTWSSADTKSKSIMIAGIIIVSILACITLVIFLSDGSSGSNSSGGFVGSDGEYHSYIPEFGNDVNSWMAENW